MMHYYQVTNSKKTFRSESLVCAINLDPKSTRAFGQLTGAFTYFTKKDSARKYLVLTEKLDPKAINPEVRKMLTEN